ncbi:MAG: response regulator, partial [Candidatus Latescibacteria bacterium]|nr:response regulator [Candidatus Latescibacterota bacterium]
MKRETRKPTILIVDDDEPTRASVRAMLEPAGYNVIEASDGEVGLNLYRQEQVDLVVMDILMPGKEGIET